MYKNENLLTVINKRIKHKPTHYNDKRRKILFAMKYGNKVTHVIRLLL